MSTISVSPLKVIGFMLLYKNTENDVLDVAYNLTQKMRMVSKSHEHISSHGLYEHAHK
jgi:hypothetical protein